MNPAPGTLIANAVKAGLGVAEDFEEREVNSDVYESEMENTLAAARALQQAEELRIRNKRTALQTKIKNALNLDNEEVNILLK